MSRSRRSEPSHGLWLRRPKHKRAERAVEQSDDAIRSEGLHTRNRRAIPPSAWDDLTVSHYRGQPWARR